MKILSGIDLVYLPRFKKSLKNGGENFLRRVFLDHEINHLRGGGIAAKGGKEHLGGEIEHLAGIFAAKEAVIKALSLPPDSWHDIQISHKKNGDPKVQLHTSHFPLPTSNLSISHDGNYVIAHFTAILNE